MIRTGAAKSPEFVLRRVKSDERAVCRSDIAEWGKIKKKRENPTGGGAAGDIAACIRNFSSGGKRSTGAGDGVVGTAFRVRAVRLEALGPVAEHLPPEGRLGRPFVAARRCRFLLASGITDRGFFARLHSREFPPPSREALLLKNAFVIPELADYRR